MFWTDQEFIKQDYTQTKLPKGDYENCRFVNCLFSKGFLDNQNFVECTFEGCDLTNTNISHTIFNDVTFEECKMVGLQFETCNQLLLSLNFVGCNLSVASFIGMHLPSIQFNDCKLHQTDFSEAHLKQAEFSGCDLENTLFENTNLEQADFTSALNFNIDPSINQLRKTRFSRDGLIGLLKKYDLVVT
ncbi:pentapeptide repeat-containing protein [Muricauda sp. TY007]|uniref:pentapeptide repeat-containing protein n=1 Tax=Allomuricauda sp. TY007 TaxID=2683200 RepID=UPI0013BFF965|nr:pentapeptide repeat-containing protein [Muricauda sp. TY007]NDV17173.1 pentapeptide repeat-containing protein [Muricauda sp. TY007]